MAQELEMLAERCERAAGADHGREADDYDYDYDDAECWNCGGEGYVYGCSWDWQCDTYDEGEGTCLCTRACHICHPPKLDPELQEILRSALDPSARALPQKEGGEVMGLRIPSMRPLPLKGHKSIGMRTCHRAYCECGWSSCAHWERKDAWSEWREHCKSHGAEMETFDQAKAREQREEKAARRRASVA